MDTETHAVVIGGGVVGCSVLFHLARFGWKNVVLLERNALGSGSSWHDGGTIDRAYTAAPVRTAHEYSHWLITKLERVSGLSSGARSMTAFNVLPPQEDVDCAALKEDGCRVIDKQARRSLLPALKNFGKGPVLSDPAAVTVNPLRTTQVLARAAEIAGARICAGERVIATELRADGSWCVVTDQRKLIAAHVINAGGPWANEIAGLADVELPLQALSAETVVVSLKTPLSCGPIALCDHRSALRLYVQGNEMKILRHGPDMPDQLVDNGGFDMVDSQLDAGEAALDAARRLLRNLDIDRIKSVFAGPAIRCKDDNAVLGPVPGLFNYWLACGAGNSFAQAGALGRGLAQWIIEGAPARDVSAFELARLQAPTPSESSTHPLRKHASR